MTNHIITAAVAAVAAIGAMALAQPKASANTAELSTVDGTDYPVCAFEDCSDQPGQVGLWEDKDTGNWWLSLGDESYLVIDDTTAP